MAKVQIDTVYGIDASGPAAADETIQDVIDRLSNEYHVTGVVVGQSTGGGWPIVEWTGPQDNLAELIEGQYDDNSGQTALVRFPEIGDDDEDTFPIVCSNGCPEGYKGIHKFSCSLARPSDTTGPWPQGTDLKIGDRVTRSTDGLAGTITGVYQHLNVQKVSVRYDGSTWPTPGVNPDRLAKIVDTSELSPQAALRKLEALLDSTSTRADGEPALQRLWTYVLRGE